MASLIKKQILKHLSKFTKNLSADKINLSTLKGEGELSNLELDCVALQNVMNLPTWLEIRKASCNKVSVKIAWTKLKTVPICIYLDAVEVDMVTCEQPRHPNGPSPIQSSASGGDTSYGFTEKVLEGMAVNINSISVNFTSAAFKATFQLSQLYVISTNPRWEKADLRYSRITDKTLGQVLTFKKLSWQTMRIVADAITTNSKSNMTPLRLITNQSEIRMTFRRRISDCQVLASCLHVHFDDLLWVLTDSQVQSALLCVKSLRDTIDRSNQQMRELGLDKMQEAQQSPAKPPPVRTDDDADGISGVNTFAAHTVVETSYHIDLDQVDLHICEEGSPIHKSSKHMQGGAIQISLHNVKVDHYPYHKPASERSHFRDYGETMKERNTWADDIIRRFRRDFMELRKAADKAGNLNVETVNRKPLRLIESCLSVRLMDIDVHEVTTSNSKKHQSGRLLNSTRKELHLPEDMPLFHFIRTEYYYPDGRDYPAPHNNIFMQLNAPRFNAHWDSLLWLNRLTLATVQAVQKMLEDLGIIKKEENSDFPDPDNVSSAREEEHVDIRIQVLMPKVFIPGPPSKHPQQPHGFEIQVSRAAVTNCRHGIDCSRRQLSQAIDALDRQYTARRTDTFPNDEEIDMPFMQKMLRRHASGEDLPLKLTLEKGNARLTGAALKSVAINDVWGVDLEQVWIDFIMPLPEQEVKEDDDTSSGGFLGTGKTNFDPIAKGLHLPFLDSFPATLWIGKSADTVKTDTAPKIVSSGMTADHDSSCARSTSNTSLNLSKPESDIGSNRLMLNQNNCNEHSVRKRSQTDADCVRGDKFVGISSFNSLAQSHPDLLSSMSDPSGRSHASSPEAESKFSPTGSDSPRTVRNRKLLDYYRSNTVDLPSVQDHDTVLANGKDDCASLSSVSSAGLQKLISTLILIHTDKSLRLQLDHHQYLFLLRMIEHVEEVGTHLDHDSKEILLSPTSSTYTSPTHSIATSEANVSNSVTQQRKKIISTTSIRLSAATADLFLILRPPPNAKEPRAEEQANSEISGKSDTFSSTSSKSGSYLLTPKEEMTSPKQEANFTPVPQPLAKAQFNIQDTPPLSECGSDNLSVQGSDNISIFGDGVYPHNMAISYMVHENQGQGRYPGESYNEDSSLSSKCESPTMEGDGKEKHENEAEINDVVTALSKKKSGSLSTLTSHDTSKTATPHLQGLSQLRNYSADNLATSVLLSAEQASFRSASTAKSNSSGYESGSYESLPPNVMKSSSSSSVSTPASSFRASHSHSSSDASDQFVVIQVDESGRGLEENGVIKLKRTFRKQSAGSPADSVSLRSETSISSCQDVTSTTTPGSDSKTMLEQDSVSSCGLADSQITVTNARSSASSLESGVQEQAQGKQENEEEEKQEPEIEMSSLVKLHVSDGVDLSIDSNDVGDSIVKIVACVVDVSELGLLKTDKIDSIFVNYAPKKSSSVQKKTKDGEASVIRPQSPQFCLRVDSGPLAGRFSPAAVKDGHIHIMADSVPLSLNSSTLSNLGAFVEDEVVPEIVPMKIEAKDVRLTIKDDLPPAYPNTPPTPPIALHVHAATVLRSEEGTFHVTTTSSGQLPTIAKKSPISEEQEPKVNEADDDKGIQTPNFPHENSPSAPPNPSVMVPNENITDMEPSPVQAPSSSQATGSSSEDRDTCAELLEKIVALERERDALTMALNHMQEELIVSERERSNLRAQLNV